MKPLYSIALILFLANCSKKQVIPINTTIQYNFTSTADAYYEITYYNEYANPVKINFYGSSWSKTIYTDSLIWDNASNGAASFQMYNTPQATSQINGYFDIIVNNKLANFENMKIFPAQLFIIVTPILRQP